jgi:hypothetical protein
VYDYFVDEKSGGMVHWETLVPPFVYTPGSALFVPTVETTRMTYFLDSLVANKHHVMFVGSTGALVGFGQFSFLCALLSSLPRALPQAPARRPSCARRCAAWTRTPWPAPPST